ncbi:hypothetical protein B0A63_23445, partial [Flavobacterium johnsoniae UW101]
KLLLITFITSIFVSFSFSNLQSNKDNIQKLLEIKKNDSIQNREIIELKDKIKVYEYKDSVFSNQLTILTAIFSTIVAISIFLIGFLIPKLYNKKNKNELKKLLNQFKTIRDEIEISRQKHIALEAKNNLNHSKTMFFSCLDSKHNNGAFLWSLRHAKDIYDFCQLSSNEDVEFYIDTALNIVNEMTTENNLKESVDEVNSLTSELIKIYSDSIEGVKEKLISIKEKYNIIAWSQELAK